MNDVKVFENEEFGSVRTVVIGGNIWFAGKDIALALGYAKPINAIRDNVDDDDTLKKGLTDSLGRMQDTVVINESGLYSLILRSQLPSAKKFKKWVTSEVLPSLRKNGVYVAKKDSYMIEDPIERAERWVEEQKEKRMLESKVQELSPKAYVYDKLIDSTLLVNFRDSAKEIGISQSQFVGWLLENGYVYRDIRGEIKPMEQYMGSGLFEMKPYQNQYNGHTGTRTYVTPRGLSTFKIMLDTNGNNRGNMRKHGGRRGTHGKNHI